MPKSWIDVLDRQLGSGRGVHLSSCSSRLTFNETEAILVCDQVGQMRLCSERLLAFSFVSERVKGEVSPKD